MLSALRYAASAIDGMRSAPGEFTTAAGGGADEALAAMWNGVGVLATATTDRPECSLDEDSTAASGMTAGSRVGALVDGADAPTAPASTRGVSTAATPKAGMRTNRPARRRAAREGGSSPYVHSTVLAV